MRRHTLFLSAGLLAYFIGASVNFYLWPPELCSCAQTMCRVGVVVEHRRAALDRPLEAIEFLLAPSCNN